MQLRRDLDQVNADLKAFLDAHPHAPEPLDGWHGKPGEGYWRDRQRDPSPGWSDDDKAHETELRRNLLDLIGKVHSHPHWDALTGPDLVKARMKLKHIDDADED
ncbi:hypothetical protein [Streptomyces inhibens]|uniref:hypothetical protein n=1 Tax=Streptomyces inhibens TaxID=2293571 RepID=UPI001EE6E513|nr:hypothetical protein [Streptomyces inhibens]UKY47871.1 hypothetical protein KI385_02870 [Streptomyces inhibens]